MKLRSHFGKVQGGQFYESHYAKSHPIRFTLPEFVGNIHNDKMRDSMADIQSSPIEKSMCKKHNEGATTLNGPFIDSLSPV